MNGEESEQTWWSGKPYGSTPHPNLRGLGGSPVEPVPVSLALNATCRGGLILQPRLGNAAAAAFADPVRALTKPFQGPLDLFPVLVEEVDQDVRRLPVVEGLRQVRILRNPCDHAAHDLVQRPVEPGFLATLGGKELEQSLVSL